MYIFKISDVSITSLPKGDYVCEENVGSKGTDSDTRAISAMDLYICAEVHGFSREGVKDRSKLISSVSCVSAVVRLKRLSALIFTYLPAPKTPCYISNE